MAPAIDLAALPKLVKITLEAVPHYKHLTEAGFLEFRAAIGRAPSAPTDQYNRPIGYSTGQAPDFTDKLRIDFPFRSIQPSHMDGTNRMAHKEVFGIAPAINE